MSNEGVIIASTTGFVEFEKSLLLLYVDMGQKVTASVSPLLLFFSPTSLLKVKRSATFSIKPSLEILSSCYNNCNCSRALRELSSSWGLFPQAELEPTRFELKPSLSSGNFLRAKLEHFKARLDLAHLQPYQLGNILASMCQDTMVLLGISDNIIILFDRL